MACAQKRAKFGLEGFYAAPWIPYSDDEDRWNVFSSIYRLCFQGLVEVQQLRLSAAEGYYLDAMRLAEQHVGSNSVAAALPASLIAEIRYEQGRLDEAEASVADRIPIIIATAMRITDVHRTGANCCSPQ